MGFAEDIERVLRAAGDIRQLDPQDYFSRREELRDIKWRPRYLYDLGDKVYAIELFRGIVVPKHLAAQMRLAQEVCEGVRAAFLVPDGEDYSRIVDICVANHIAIISRIGERFEFLRLEGLPKPAKPAPAEECRLPAALVERAASVENVDRGFAEAMALFGDKYLAAASGGELGAGNEAAEQELLKVGFAQLLAADSRFAASYTPLHVLVVFETECRQAVGRDHFFHAFHDFLLGCIVLEEAHSAFQDFATEVFGVPNLSSEYVWLLTSIFHDVGYPVEKAADFESLQYGPVAQVAELGEDGLADRIRAQRQEYWEGWLVLRAQLASLWDYLHLDKPDSAWLPEPEPYDDLREHPLDRALYRGFMSKKCHGAASCLRFLGEMHRLLRGETDQQRRAFLLSHIYLAALSIPFHHHAFRKACRSVGINRLSTRRFPFASLLMYIDSIQDDRREPDLSAQGPDVLRGLSIEGGTVTAVIDGDTLTPEQVRQIAHKVEEAQDVLEFLQQDGLKYRYPPEILGEGNGEGV